MAYAFPPSFSIASASAWSRFNRRAHNIITAPCRASILLQLSPNPLDAPVTSAVLPRKQKRFWLGVDIPLTGSAVILRFLSPLKGFYSKKFVAFFRPYGQYSEYKCSVRPFMRLYFGFTPSVEISSVFFQRPQERLAVRHINKPVFHDQKITTMDH